MNIFKKLGLLNSILLAIIIFFVVQIAWSLTQYYNETEIKPALRESKAQQNTTEIPAAFQFQPRFETKDWAVYTSDIDTPLLTVKFPSECFPVRTYDTGYCSFDKEQRMPTRASVKNEVFEMDYSFDGNDFADGAKNFIDQLTSSDSSRRLSDFEILEKGEVFVDGNKAYLLRMRGKPVGEDSYVYQNYLMFYVKYSDEAFPNRIYPWHLYNESNAPSQYFDTVVSTIRFTQNQK